MPPVVLICLLIDGEHYQFMIAVQRIKLKMLTVYNNYVCNQENIKQ